MPANKPSPPWYYADAREGHPVDELPWQWTKKGFLLFAKKRFPNATDDEHELIALGIETWFYGDWSNK